MLDQKDPSQMYALVLFESEEEAHAREQDPRRQETLQEVSAQMAEIDLLRPIGVHRPHCHQLLDRLRPARGEGKFT